VHRAEGHLHPVASRPQERRRPCGAEELGPGPRAGRLLPLRHSGELAKLNEIWELDAVFANYFLPQQKLVFKQRNGAKVTKRHDTAATPHQPAVAHDAVRKRPIITMDATFKRLKPAALSRQILALTGELEVLAQAKKAPRTRPPVNHAWNDQVWRRNSNEATS
jgi:hypothetical protein